MARNIKKEDNVVGETVAEDTKAPTQSLFGNVKTDAVQSDATETEGSVESQDEAQTVDTATETAETVSEVAETAQEEASASTETSDSNLENLSVEELRRRQEEITRTLDEKTNAEKKGVLDQVILVIAEYGITTEEVVTALGGYKVKRKGVPARIKYRDPVTGAEWSGRGKEPLWIKGKDRAPFAVPEEQAMAA